MFGLFGSKPKKSVEDELIPELKKLVVQTQDSTGISYLAITMPMLSMGTSLMVHEKGPEGLAQAINRLSRKIEEEQRTLGSLGSAIMDVGVPELPRQHTDLAIDKLGDFATFFSRRGYTLDEIGSAMSVVSSQIAKLIDKDNLLHIGMLRKELATLREKYRHDQFSRTAAGEPCTKESVDILLEAEAAGFSLTVENNRTFVLTKGGSLTHYLRSNSDISQFGKALKASNGAEETKQDPVEKLAQQGHDNIRTQNLEGAISAFSAALRISPEDRDLHFHRGVAWSNSYYNRGKKSGDLQRAIDDYTRSIEIDPEFAEGYFQRAGLLSDQGKSAAAISDYGKAIERNHKASSAYYCRGLLWQATGETGKAKALADFAGAIRTGSRDDQFMALMARADAHIQFEDFELALDDLNAADAYYPEGPPGLYEKRGGILMNLGRMREAIAEFSKGIAAASPLASPEFIANIYEQRGRCRNELGEAQLARQDLDRAAQLRRGGRRG